MRERISINSGWRYRKDDPDGMDSNALRYDRLPEVTNDRDDQPADSKPKEAIWLASDDFYHLKPWILPTGNALIKDQKKWFARPDTPPAVNVLCSRNDYDDSKWQPIDLPHDWAIYGPFNQTESGVGGGMGRLPSPGIGWYRRKIDISPLDQDKQIILEIDGAMSYASVWINGHIAGGWPYGYSSFQVDITPYLKFNADNIIAIRLENLPDSSRWYPGGGIYRNVWLTKTHKLHIAQWGTWITTPQVSSDSASIHLSVSIDNRSTQAESVHTVTEIYELDSSGNISQSVANIRAPITNISPSESLTLSTSTNISNPNLWGPPPLQQPNCYIAKTQLIKGDEVIDEYTTRFGIREIVCDANQGVLVNGQKVKLQGVNQHHDLGALGAAFNYRAAQRQLEMLQELGCNAIRMAHNPPAPELLELTDRMGFLVINEVFDCWYRRKPPLDFHLVFPDWYEQDLRGMILRDRNCPSVFLWSIGNEVGEQYTDRAGADVVKMLCDISRDQDPTRPATASMNFAKPEMPFAESLDVICLNYQGEGIRDTPEFEGTNRIRTFPQYDAYRKKYPGKMIVSSETASTLSTRGTYLFPVSAKINAPVRDGAGGDSKNKIVSCYELNSVDFGSTPDKVFHAQDRHPYVAGEFVWTGWDHLGEPTPYYGARSSYCGIIDIAGFKKDRFYLYQSRWRPDLPMVHILPHWTWPERVGQITPIHVFTSGDEAELFLNGKSLGRKKKTDFEYRLRWDDVRYVPGKIEVVAYKKQMEWARSEMITAHEAAAIQLTIDRSMINQDGIDLAFITARITDQNGITSPRADHQIRFTIEGPGEIVATDNGDPRSFELFQSPERHAFSGYCLAIVRFNSNQICELRLTASAENLKSDSIMIRAQPG